MAQKIGYDFLDFLVVLVNYKKKILLITITSMIIGYLLIYFLIPPQFESKALLVSKEEGSLGMMGAISETLSSLPLGSFGFGSSSGEKYDLFTTLLYSRTNLEKLIKKFDLMNEYGEDEVEKAIKILEKSIAIDKTEENALSLVVVAGSPEKSAAMTNFILDDINKQLIELNIKKSKENRIFLEDRLIEIKDSLRVFEDKLRDFQQKNDFIDVENQVRLILTSFADLEGELVQKEIQVEVMKKFYGENNPQFNLIKGEVEILRSKINDIKTSGRNNSLMTSMVDLPQIALDYIRLFRNVEIQNRILEFVLPLYEQARLEEVKDIPSLDIIDYGVEPEKKSYPPRTLFTLVIGIFVALFSSSYYFLQMILNNSSNERLIYIRKELFNFRKKDS